MCGIKITYGEIVYTIIDIKCYHQSVLTLYVKTSPKKLDNYNNKNYLIKIIRHYADIFGII